MRSDPTVPRTLAAIVDALPGMVGYWDRDFRCRYANRNYLEWFGKRPEEIVGQHMLTLMGERLFELSKPGLLKALAGERQSFERKLTRSDGSTGYTWAHYIPDFDAAGTVQGLVVLATDVTPMKEQAEAKLRESEERYRRLAENSGDVVFQIDHDLVRRYVSPSSHDILGYHPEELINGPPLSACHPEDAERVASAMRAMLAGEVERTTVLARSRHRDGHWVWLENGAKAMRDPATGKVTGVVCALRDVSRRVMVEQELAQAQKRLEILATRDGLTDLLNRRQFDETFATEYRRAAREGCSLGLILIDVDRFKAFNDRFGHPAGDRCLRCVADAISATIRRPGDVAARYGGEEFAVLLPNTHEAGAAEIAERIRLAVRDLDIDHPEGPGGRVTISAGVAAGARVEGREHLLKDADRALYRAKHLGRNQVANASWPGLRHAAAH